MIDLPFNPDDLGYDTMLARYLRADPARLAVLTNIASLLDDDGAVGDKARHYIVQSHLRRAVLRGVLICEGIPIPSWAYENSHAARSNKRFVSGYRTRRAQALHDQSMPRRCAA